MRADAISRGMGRLGHAVAGEREEGDASPCADAGEGIWLRCRPDLCVRVHCVVVCDHTRASYDGIGPNDVKLPEQAADESSDEES